MDTLGKRVKKIIVFHGTTMTSFAKELNISQSMVSKICADKATPSDRTLSDICRIYNINKEWLLQGAGEMTDTHSLETELYESFDRGESSTLSDDVKHNLISALVNTPPVAWPMIAEYMRNIADEYKKNPNGVGSYMDGYKEGIRMWQKVKEMMDSLSDEPKE